MSDELIDEDEAPPPAEEMPSGMERRLVLQLMSYWRDLRSIVYEDEDEDEDDEDDEALEKYRSYPAFLDIEGSEIPDIWPSCFVLKLPKPGGQVSFRSAGDEYEAHYPGKLRSVRITDLKPDTLAEHSTSYLPEVIAKGVPITRGGEFTNGDGDLVLYRSIILPLSDDGETIDGFVGAANCRIVPKQ